MEQRAKNVFLTYANEAFIEPGEAFRKSALNVGFDEAILYTRDRLEETEFYRSNMSILDEPRGNGFWLWKPYIIYETLQTLGPDDVLVYNDAGRSEQYDFFDALPSNLIALTRALPEGILAGFSLNWPYQARFTKRDCLILMEADQRENDFVLQLGASWSLWRKTPEAIAFLEAWLHFGTMRACITDDENTLGQPNHEHFQEHRHDQAIFSILVHQRRVPFFDMHSKFGVEQAREDKRRYGGNAAYPKRVFNAERILQHHLTSMDAPADGTATDLVERLSRFIHYVDKTQEPPQVKTDGTLPRAVRKAQASKLIESGEHHRLEWYHIRSFFGAKQLADWKANMDDKRDEYQDFIRARFTEYFLSRLGEIKPRVIVAIPLEDFIRDHVDLSTYPGDVDDITRPPAAQLQREAFNASVRSDPDALEWKTLWRSVSHDERVLLRSYVKKFKSADWQERFRAALLDHIRKTGSEVIDCEPTFAEIWAEHEREQALNDAQDGEADAVPERRAAHG